MRNKLIAGLVMVPLLVGVDAPAWSGEASSSQHELMAEARSVHDTGARAAHHSHCAGLVSHVAVNLYPLADPCDGQHGSCFSRGPAVPSSLPVRSDRALARKAISSVEGAPLFVVLLRNSARVDASCLYSLLSMVLRN